MQSTNKHSRWNIVAGCLFLIIATASPAVAKINVVTTIKPIHSLVAGVMRGTGSPELLLETGSPHTYALKPSNASALQSADLVIWIGPKLETFLTGSLSSLSGKTRLLTLEGVDELTLHKVREDEHEHGHGHEHGQVDPHIWLDPENAKTFITAIEAALASADPANKAVYSQNANTMIERLSKLARELETELTPLKDKPFLTFHDAYQYFEKRFHLNYAGSIAINPDRQPGARHLRNLKKTIRQKGITCIFREPQFKSKLVDLILEGTTARSASLDPVGASIKKGPEHYFSLLRKNARAFKSCLGGS